MEYERLPHSPCVEALWLPRPCLCGDTNVTACWTRAASVTLYRQILSFFCLWMWGRQYHFWKLHGDFAKWISAVCSVIDCRIGDSASDYITTDSDWGVIDSLNLMNIPVTNPTIQSGTVRTIARTTFKYKSHTPGKEYERLPRPCLWWDTNHKQNQSCASSQLLTNLLSFKLDFLNNFVAIYTPHGHRQRCLQL